MNATDSEGRLGCSKVWHLIEQEIWPEMGVEEKGSSAPESDTMTLLRNMAMYSKRKVSLLLPLHQRCPWSDLPQTVVEYCSD